MGISLNNKELTERGGAYRWRKIIMLLIWHITYYLCSKHLHHTAPFCRSIYRKPLKTGHCEATFRKSFYQTSMLTRWTANEYSPAYARKICCPVIFSHTSCLSNIVAKVKAAIVWPGCTCLHVIWHRYVMHQRSKILGMLCLPKEPSGCFAASNTS